MYCKKGIGMLSKVWCSLFVISLVLAGSAGGKAASQPPPAGRQVSCERDIQDILSRIATLEYAYLSKKAADKSQGARIAPSLPSYKELAGYSNSVHYIEFKIKNIPCSDILAYRLHYAFYPCYKLIGDIWRAREYCKDASAKNRMHQLIDLANVIYPKISSTIPDTDLGICLQTVATEGLEQQRVFLQQVAELAASEERTLYVLDEMLLLAVKIGNSRMQDFRDAIEAGKLGLETNSYALPEKLQSFPVR